LYRQAHEIYSIKYELKVPIELIPSEEFHEVQEISSLELNQKMTNAFHFRYGTITSIYPNRDGRSVLSRNQVPFSVYCTDLPMNVAFRVKFVDDMDENRQHIAVSEYSIVQEEGESFEISSVVMPDLFSGLARGIHKGKWILFSDPTLAYGNPLITNVWKGELVYPVEFNVSAKDSKIDGNQ
jgi:hypothetical protein